LQGWQNVVEQNTAEGVSPNGVLRNPKAANSRLSANRLLCAGLLFHFIGTYIIQKIHSIIIFYIFRGIF
jgi:hypothetical protein